MGISQLKRVNLCWVLSKEYERDSRLQILNDALETGARSGIDCVGSMVHFQQLSETLDQGILERSLDRLGQSDSMLEVSKRAAIIEDHPTGFRDRLQASLVVDDRAHVVLVHRSSVWSDDRLAPWFIGSILAIRSSRPRVVFVAEELTSPLRWGSTDHDEIARLVFDEHLPCEYPTYRDIANLLIRAAGTNEEEQ